MGLLRECGVDCGGDGGGGWCGYARVCLWMMDAQMETVVRVERLHGRWLWCPPPWMLQGCGGHHGPGTWDGRALARVVCSASTRAGWTR